MARVEAGLDDPADEEAQLIARPSIPREQTGSQTRASSSKRFATIAGTVSGILLITGALAAALLHARVSSPGPLSQVAAAMDFTADPCTDWYQYTCGGYLANTHLPPDRGYITKPFFTIQRNVEDVLANIFASNSTAKHVELFRSCMAEHDIEQQGTQALNQLLRQLDDIGTNMEQLGPFLVTTVDLAADNPLFSVNISPDDKEPSQYAVFLSQPSLSLPSKEYYTESGEMYKSARAALENYIFEILAALTGDEDGSRSLATKILQWETDLASVSVPSEDLRDPEANYNPMSVGDADALADGRLFLASSLSALAQKAGETIAIQNVIVSTVDFFKGIKDILPSVTTGTGEQSGVLTSWIKFRILDVHTASLGHQYREAAQRFASAVYGAKEMAPRQKVCSSLVSSLLPHDVGKDFVSRAFPGESKDAALKLVDAVKSAMKKDFATVAWMDEETRNIAIEKMDAIASLIGYPDHWDTYDGVVITRARLLESVLSARAFQFRKLLRRLSSPVDRTEWSMPPQQVNAYYSPARNIIAFPAAILQPPMFESTAPDALNFGSIGAVVGHELSHAFDDYGSQYDKTGKLNPWITPDSRERFHQASECVVKQYGDQLVLPDLRANGKLTLGENLADFGGAKNAYYAFKEAHPNAAGPSGIAGLSSEQLFFVSYAQTWCTLASAEAIRRRTLSDPHSVGKLRATLPLANLPDFANAFSCPRGTAMHPEALCSVW